MRGATYDLYPCYYNHVISIHTPHAGSDSSVRQCLDHCINFNPHSPCGERLYQHASRLNAVHAFQSTLPMRGATIFGDYDFCSMGISIHTPHAGSDLSAVGRPPAFSRYFNPHSPCGERLTTAQIQQPTMTFQSTLPMRGATGVCQRLGLGHGISIHTPHAGSDAVALAVRYYMEFYFNPHSPCGERPPRPVIEPAIEAFQSTLPMRGATPRARKKRAEHLRISIHTPHAGSDP